MAPPPNMPSKPTKLPPIPKGSKISKRPLTHPFPTTSSPKLYVSSRTPFPSLTSRIRKSLQKQHRSNHKSLVPHKSKPQQPKKTEKITVLGTGKAIAKTLSVASFFSEQSEYEVEVRTRSVGAVDDVVVEEGEGEDEARLRRVSCLEVVVRLR